MDNDLECLRISTQLILLHTTYQNVHEGFDSLTDYLEQRDPQLLHRFLKQNKAKQ